MDLGELVNSDHPELLDPLAILVQACFAFLVEELKALQIALYSWSASHLRHNLTEGL